VLGSTVPVQDGGPSSGSVAVLVRPENLTVTPAEGGNGIVFLRTFLGATSRITVLLSGDLQVLVDVPSTHAAAMTPGASVSVAVPSDPVLVVAAEG
jgi:putative spermidine/putrescine transport system ATP-binding protein